MTDASESAALVLRMKRELMDLVKSGKVKPLPVAARGMAEAQQTLEDLQAGRIVGRVVLVP